MPTEAKIKTGEGQPESWQMLLRTAQHWEVQDAGNLLESEDIPTVVRTENFSGTYFEPFFQKHDLFVPTGRVQDATDVIEDSAYEKCLIDRKQDLEDVTGWRARDAVILLSGFLIGIVDVVVLYGLYLLEFLRNLITPSDEST